MHIELNDVNDWMGDARNHIARRVGAGAKQSDIVRDAWSRRDASNTGTTSAQSVSDTPYACVEIYYDPIVTDCASEAEVIKALRKAGRG